MDLAVSTPRAGRDGEIRTTRRTATDLAPAAPVIDEKTSCWGEGAKEIVCVREGSATPFVAVRANSSSLRFKSVSTSGPYLFWMLDGLRMKKFGPQ